MKTMQAEEMIEKAPIITGINYKGIFAAQLEAEEIPEFTGKVKDLTKLFLTLGKSYKSMTGKVLEDLNKPLIEVYIIWDSEERPILRKYFNYIVRKLNEEYEKINNDKELEAAWKLHMELFVAQLVEYKGQCLKGRKEALMAFYNCLGGGSSDKAYLSSTEKINAFFRQQIEEYKMEVVRQIVSAANLGYVSQHFQMNICAGLMDRGYLQKNQDYLDNKEKDTYGRCDLEYYMLQCIKSFDLNALCNKIAENPETKKVLGPNGIRVLQTEIYVYLYDWTQEEINAWVLDYEKIDIRTKNYRKAVIAYVLDDLGVIEIKGLEGLLDIDKMNAIEDLLGSKGKKVSLCDIVPGSNNEDLSSDTEYQLFSEVMAVDETAKDKSEPLLTKVDQFLSPKKQKNMIDIILPDDVLNKKNTIKFVPEVAGVLIVAALSTSLFCSFYYGGLIVEQEMIVQSFCGISTSLELLELGALTIAVPIGIAVIAAMISGVIRNKSSAHEI